MESPEPSETRYETWRIACAAAYQDDLAYLLGERGAEGIHFEGDTLIAYAQLGDLDADTVAELLDGFGARLLARTHLPEKNWNALWEAQATSVELSNETGTWLQIVPEHRTPRQDCQHTLRITPEMAFGSGHHATTRLVLQWLYAHPPRGKTVLDLGCGTGVLGLFADRLGATLVDFVDTDPIAVKTAQQNALRNGTSQARTVVGTLEEAPMQQYDNILANINRNALIDLATPLRKKIAPNGVLVLSGVLISDIPIVLPIFEAAGWVEVDRTTEAEWVCLAFSLS